MKNLIITKSTLPKVTFGIVTLNEEKRIKACLSAIAIQEYPKEKIEIIVMDGGSTDKTVEIAKKYRAKIYFNEKKLAEPGLAAAYQKATGDYMVFMAADNIIYDKYWTRKIVQPFLDDVDNILVSFSRVVNSPSDNIWNKYLNEDTDPFSAFVFNNASCPDKFKKIYTVEKENSHYAIYNYKIENFPLIALAQCTVLKTKIRRKLNSNYDDILPLIDIIKKGGKIAYVKDTGIYHFSVKGFTHLRMKFKKRIFNSIKTDSYVSRESYVSTERKIRRYLFLLYSFSLIIPLLEGIRLMIIKRKFYMLLHPIVSFIIGFYIIINFIKIKIWQK
nr:glycosyltransferase family 2 protein [Candidatus Levybacteria bacterium]